MNWKVDNNALENILPIFPLWTHYIRVGTSVLCKVPVYPAGIEQNIKRMTTNDQCRWEGGYVCKNSVVNGLRYNLQIEMKRMRDTKKKGEKLIYQFGWAGRHPAIKIDNKTSREIKVAGHVLWLLYTWFGGWIKCGVLTDKCIFTQKNKSTCMNIHNNNRRLIWRWDGGSSVQVYIYCNTFFVMISMWVKWNVCVILIHQSNNNIHCQNWIFQEIYCFCLAFLDDMMIIITIVVRG